jgi:hypothetical protein
MLTWCVSWWSDENVPPESKKPPEGGLLFVGLFVGLIQKTLVSR